MAATAPAGGTPEPDALPAGSFSEWRREMLAALAGAATAEVPCGACTACCRSSMFVHIGPDEVETLRRVPLALLFPAPGRPAGHMVLGYDEHGRCPMLLDDRCSIYDHRPRTCRTYDCRVFPAAGLSPDGDAKRPIARQAARWRFDHPTPADVEDHAGVRRAAAFLLAHPDRLPDGRAPDLTRLAVLAVEAGEPERVRDPRGPADGD